MKLLQIIASVNPADGGPVEGLLQQARLAAHHGVDMHVVSLDSPDKPYVAAFPCPVFALGSDAGGGRQWLPWRRYGFQSDVSGWLRRHVRDYDAVVVNGLWNYSTMAARLALVGSGVPYAVFIHGMLDPWFRKTYPAKHLAKQLFWLACEGPLVRGANAVLFTTEDEQIVSDRAFWPYRANASVVGYGTRSPGGTPEAQAAAFRQTMPLLDGRRFLLFLSRIHEKKGIDLLIRAFARVAPAHPDLDLVIAGPDSVGLQSSLMDLARTLGIAHRIHWPGMLTDDLKWGAFRSCEAFVLPSHQENFGVVVAEALLCRKMVLISNKVQIWREVEAAGAGLIAEDTLEGTHRLLDRFLQLPADDRHRMEQNAEALFLAKFDLEKMVVHFFDTVRKLTG